jgi:putative pyoverdin transport system ATP-binding/permease protein
MLLCRKLLIFLIALNITVNDRIYAIGKSNNNDSISEKILDFMTQGKIPGLSIAIIKNGQVSYMNFGFEDLKTNKKVSAKTLFEIGSCSKAFTGIGILNLEKQGILKLDDPVSKYLPWFRAYYHHKKCEITIRQLLHHTSGIPRETISDIPKDSSQNALERTVKIISGVELKNKPGKEFEYATINYDIIGLIIEKASGKAYEEYMLQSVLIPLGMNNTSLRIPKAGLAFATGYKIGYFAPREYDAPIFRGNLPAGYVVSNAEDLALWLSHQMGLIKSNFDSLIISSHLRDESVSPSRGDLSSYAAGWFISLKGDGKIFHGGLNPNFTTYMAFDQKTKIGLVVLANSNSSYTSVIGDYLFETLHGGVFKLEYNPESGFDKPFSILSIILGIFLIGIICYIFYLIFIILKGNRKYSGFTIKKISGLVFIFLLLIPILYAIYLIPRALIGLSWEAMLVWAPVSFVIFTVILISLIGLGYVTHIINLLFPHPNSYWRSAPGLIVLSMLSGLSNMVVILIIIGSVGKTEIEYNLFYFILVFIIYILGRKFVQTALYKLTMNIVFDLRIKLVRKILATSYQHFEKIDTGRIYSTLNDDTGTMGNSANIVVNLITSVITALGAFIYLASMAFWATIAIIVIITIIVLIYNNVTRKAIKHLEKARDTQNDYLKLINGLVGGFKELSLHNKKKKEYQDEIILTSDTYRKRNVFANIKFINAFLVGESMLILVLGFIAFGLTKLFPEIGNYMALSFVIVLLYLIGPVNGILGSIPNISQMKIAWKRIHQFLIEIPANVDENKIEALGVDATKKIQKLVAKEIIFEYKNNNAHTDFKVGPINFELRNGEALFIIGGNGSGKTTLAKLITGLYKPDSGIILINGKKVHHSVLGEHFSTVLNPFYLFDKMYNINTKEKANELDKFLNILGLEDKVKVIGNKYSTIDLSGGQRKRLALLQCYLEDKPIYLFDEWAADQDPEYRKFFYRELIPEMKEQGKIIIAITHDDHYFDVADKVLKLDMGKVEYLKAANEINKGVFTQG